MTNEDFDRSAVIRDTIEESIAEIDKQIDGVQEELKKLRAEDGYIVRDYEERFHAITTLGEAVMVIESGMEHSGLYPDGDHRLASGEELLLPNNIGGHSSSHAIRARISSLRNEMNSLFAAYRRQGAREHSLLESIALFEDQKADLEEIASRHKTKSTSAPFVAAVVKGKGW